MSKPNRPSLIRCQVTVRTSTSSFSYHGIFPSTCDALLAALDQYGTAHVCVRAVR